MQQKFTFVEFIGSIVPQEVLHLTIEQKISRFCPLHSPYGRFPREAATEESEEISGIGVIFDRKH